MAEVGKRKPGKADKNPLAVYTRIADKGVPITDNIVKMMGTLAELKKAFPEIRKTGTNILFVASKDKFPDRRKAMKIGYAVLYLNNVLEKLADRVEKRAEKNDIEELADYADSPAFRDFLIVAWKQCNDGGDEKMKERYDALYEGLKPLAGRYSIKLKNYGGISKKDADVDINDIKPHIEREEEVGMESPEKISKKDVVKFLEAFAGKMDAELRKLMKIPGKMFVQQKVIFSDREDFTPIEMLQSIYGGVDGKKPAQDSGYGLMIEESAGHSYILFIDTERRVAVKSVISSEGKAGWDEFKNKLKECLKEASKTKKEFSIKDVGME